MQIKKILNKKEIEDIENILESHYGCRANLNQYTVFITSENKVWITSKKISKSFFTKIKRCYRIGIYFGKIKRNKKIKLTVEGLQMIKKNADKNIAIISKKEMVKYMQGYNITIEKLIKADINNFILIKYKTDFLGIGILRDNYIESAVPKARRMNKVEEKK
jgi:NOL1/NOP2/fmu family ribosome biogenesis protein